MSGLRFIIVECNYLLPDGEECAAESDDARWTLAEARERARNIGWAVALPGGKDLCPDHAEHAPEFRRRIQQLASGVSPDA